MRILVEKQRCQVLSGGGTETGDESTCDPISGETLEEWLIAIGIFLLVLCVGTIICALYAACCDKLKKL